MSGKQPVVGLQLQLAGTRTGVTDDCRAETPHITRRHAAGEEHPGVGATAGARDLQRSRYAKGIARLHKRPRIVPPFRLVEVDRQEIAAVALQQWVHPDRVLTGKVVVDHRIGQRNQQSIAAIPALDARLLADTGAPFVRAGWRVARLAAGLAFPADGVNVGAAAKQPAKQCHLLSSGKPGRLRLSRHKNDRLRRTPLDTVRFEQRDQARVFSSQSG